ncbi:zinc-finger domain-containing protein [Chitinimonas sp. JJ19]|uniref:zinc-finger domain-containing protein n=1 Tax=Chitinimonas sp. JJ19 TaxID=3109352 RepID=UPI003003030E
MTQLKENNRSQIEVEAKDLPLYCPMPDMVKWNAHPRVVIPVGNTGEALCPYCGTKYVLKGGPVGHGH